ncbi:MAG TPA: hypothetical protein DDX91_09950 [Ruminococcaceae bacterium]|nr:hypothetical protein [Oscillospiraceae bacterium]
MSINVREIKESDLDVLADFMRRLNEYEGLGDKCIISKDAYREMIFGEKCLFGLIAEKDGKAAGAALYYFYRISSLGGKRVLFLEELFVLPDQRKKGIGTAIMEAVKKAAKAENALRIEWKCLKDNPSVAFYDRICEKSENIWNTYEIYFKNF